MPSSTSVISMPACAQHVQRAFEQVGTRAFQHHVAAGHADGHRIGAGLDTVGDHAVARARQRGDAGNADFVRARAFDLRAHRVQAVGEIDDLRLARRVFEDRVALGERRRHQRHMRRADGNLGKRVTRADKPVPRLRMHIAVFDLDIGAQRFERVDEQIDRPRADGAAAGQRHPRLAHARQERPDHPETRPHLRDQLVGRGDVDDVARGEMHRARIVGILRLPPAGHRIVDAVVRQDADQRFHIGQMRHVFQRQRVVRQEATRSSAAGWRSSRRKSE
jgi:hypothetical protein